MYEPIGYVQAVHGDATTPNPSFGSAISYVLGEGVHEGQIAIVIEDAGGSVVRKLSGPNTPGLHQIQWDLRGVTGEGDAPRRRNRSGELVQPGQYKLKLLRATDGESTVLGDVQTINVKAIR